MRAFLWSLLCVLLLLPPIARAQDDEAHHLFEAAGPLSMPVSWRGLSDACRRIGFDVEQLGSAKTLYQGYRAGVRESLAKGRHAMKNLEKLNEGENPDWERFEAERNKATEQFVREIEAHERSFMTDLHALCSPAQEAQFIRVEQARRREQARVFTIAPGEALNISALLHIARATRTPEVEAAIAHWEDSLDKILVERERMIRELMKRDAQRAGAVEWDRKEEERAFSQFRIMSQRIGDLNRRTATDIATLLPAAEADRFLQEVRVRSFPRIFGGSKVDRGLRVARARADLTREQHQKLDELSSAYQQAAEPINIRWMAAAEDKFRNMPDDPMAALGLTGESDEEREKEPFYAIRKERRALDDKFMIRIMGVLNEEQRDALAKAEEAVEEHEFLPEFLPDVGKDFEASVKQWTEEPDEESPV